MTDESTIHAVEKEWFVRDRFGMFIHWGLYAMPARHEWVMSRERISAQDYQRYFERFDPDLYDPVAWAKAAKRAGMRYVVVTTKHHEGFCLWDSALTDYKAPNTPAGRDLIMPLVDAVRAEGLKIGFYHSLFDWHHPEFPIDGLHPQRDDLSLRKASQNREFSRYLAYLHGQVRELMTRFGKIDIIWFDFSYPDSDWGWSKGRGRDDWQSEKLMAMIRELQPDIMFNDRLDVPGDFRTPEQYQPEAPVVHNGRSTWWEACQTMNGSWGYDRDNLDWKSEETLVRLLIDSVSKSGNLLLNVGPNSRGEIEPKALHRLHAIGEWMRLHSRSIYGCSASDFTPPPDCRFTQNGSRLYLHLFSWPFRHIHLKGFRGLVDYAQLLNDGSEVKMLEIDPEQRAQNTAMSAEAGELVLEIPVQKPDVVVPVIELFMKE